MQLCCSSVKALLKALLKAHLFSLVANNESRPHSSIQALLRLSSGAIKALLRRYKDAIKTLFKALYKAHLFSEEASNESRPLCLMSSPYVSASSPNCIRIRQHTSAYTSSLPHAQPVCLRQLTQLHPRRMRQHTSACVSIRQHASAVSIRQHTSAYVLSASCIQARMSPRAERPAYDSIR